MRLPQWHSQDLPPMRPEKRAKNQLVTAGVYCGTEYSRAPAKSSRFNPDFYRVPSTWTTICTIWIFPEITWATRDVWMGGMLRGLLRGFASGFASGIASGFASGFASSYVGKQI